MQLGVGFQRGIQVGTGLLFASQALPGHQQHLQQLAVVGMGGQQRTQVLQRLQRLGGLQRQLCGQAAHRQRVLAGLCQGLFDDLRSGGRVVLAQRQLHQQSMQAGHLRVQRQHAAERLFGEGQHVLAQVGETQRIKDARIIRQGSGGGSQLLQRFIQRAAAQRHHAGQRGNFRMAGIQARRQACLAVGLVHIVARQRQVRLHQIGGKFVRVEAGGALQRSACIVELAQGEQQAGVLQVQVGVVRRQGQRALQTFGGRLQLALLLQRQGMPAMGLGQLRFGGGPGLGQLHGLIGVAATQGLKDLVLHGGPALRANPHCSGPGRSRPIRPAGPPGPDGGPPSVRRSHLPASFPGTRNALPTAPSAGWPTVAIASR